MQNDDKPEKATNHTELTPNQLYQRAATCHCNVRFGVGIRRADINPRTL